MTALNQIIPGLRRQVTPQQQHKANGDEPLPPNNAGPVKPDPYAELRKGVSQEQGDWNVALARFHAACVDPRPLIPAGNAEHFNEHLAAAWGGVNALNQSRPLEPVIGQRSRRPVELYRNTDGLMRLAFLDTATLRKPFAEACFWYGRWKTKLIGCPAPFDPSSYIAAVAALSKVTPQPHGYIQAVEGKGDDGMQLAFIFPTPQHPSTAIMNAAETAPPDLLPLEAALPFPVYTSDKGIIRHKGYCPAVHAYIDPGEVSKVSAADAVPVLREFLEDVCFETDADFANTIAALITPIVRHAVNLAPMCVYEKPQHQTGVTLLADVLNIILTGRPAPWIQYTRDKDEMEKRIAASYNEGDVLLGIDNVDDRLDSQLLASCLTVERPSLRILGRTGNFYPDTRHSTWRMTGRSVTLSSELMKRCFVIRLNAQHPDPSKRSGPSTGPRAARGETDWKYPDLRLAAQELRPRLLGAALALIESWHKTTPRLIPSGLPNELGNFPLWKRVVGGILQHNGITGFLENAAAFERKADTTGQEVDAFINAWWSAQQHNPVDVAQLRGIARLDGDDGQPIVALHTKTNSKAAIGTAFSSWLRRECLDRPHILSDGSGVLCAESQYNNRRGNAKYYALTPNQIANPANAANAFPNPGILENDRVNGKNTGNSTAAESVSSVSRVSKCAISGGGYSIGADGFCEPCRAMGGDPCTPVRR